ncbi:hypothetical protein MTO96_002812 [Rhipicephalus appendiculatus]
MDLFFPQRLARYDLRTSESFDCQECFGYGAFQKRLFILLILSGFSVISQTSIVTLVFGDGDHWCKRPMGFNISAAEWKNIAIPLEADGRLSKCRIYERCVPPVDLSPSKPAADGQRQAVNDTREIPCDEWEYDDSVADSTAVSSWNLVCHRRLLRIAVVALQYAGAVIFLVTSGLYADSLSRRSCLLASALMERLREQVKARTRSPKVSDKEILDTNSLRRRALALFFAYFSMTFSYYVAVFTTAPIHKAWIPYGIAAATLFACGSMLVLVTDIALVTVMNTCFVMIAVVDCLLCAAAVAGMAPIKNILNVLSRGVSLDMLIHFLVFVMELFPSAVRSGTLCWVFASGRVGAMFASVTFVLQVEGREDVAFAVAALLLFVSLLVIRVLPRATMVEQAKEANIGTSYRRNYIQHMRRTLDRSTDNKTKCGSTEVPKCRQSLASNTDVSLKGSSGSSEVRKNRKSLASSADSFVKARRLGHKFSQKPGLPKSVPMSMTQADADIG